MPSFMRQQYLPEPFAGGTETQGRVVPAKHVAFGPRDQTSGGDFRKLGGSFFFFFWPGVLATTISVTIEGNRKTPSVVSKDGKFLFRGELNDMSKILLAEESREAGYQDAPARALAGPIQWGVRGLECRYAETCMKHARLYRSYPAGRVSV